MLSTALFGSRQAFYIDSSNTWGGGPLHHMIYISQISYVFLLAAFSGIYFKRKNIRQSMIVAAIFAQAVLVAFLEATNIVPGYSNPITALCMLEYYIYLSTIYQQEMRTQIDDILKYYHFKSVEIPKSIKEHEEQLDHSLRPHGLMKRQIILE